MHQKPILNNIFNGLKHLKDEIGAILTLHTESQYGANLSGSVWKNRII